jgi:uncharacterized protein
MNERSERIDYVELRGGELDATTAFYRQAFGWGFVDYGPDYAGFEGDPAGNVLGVWAE